MSTRVDRPAAPPRRRVLFARVVRGLALAVAAFAVTSTVLLVVACFVDDQRIDADMGSAVATVSEVTARRAAVEFVTAEGRPVRPSTGVFYPTGLSEGQRVRVEYRRANPELVRVSGRSWTTAVWPALSVSVIALPLCALAYRLASPRVHRTSPRIT